MELVRQGACKRKGLAPAPGCRPAPALTLAPMPTMRQLMRPRHPPAPPTPLSNFKGRNVCLIALTLSAVMLTLPPTGSNDRPSLQPPANSSHSINQAWQIRLAPSFVQNGTTDMQNVTFTISVGYCQSRLSRTGFLARGPLACQACFGVIPLMAADVAGSARAPHSFDQGLCLFTCSAVQTLLHAYFQCHAMQATRMSGPLTVRPGFLAADLSCNGSDGVRLADAANASLWVLRKLPGGPG